MNVDPDHERELFHPENLEDESRGSREKEKTDGGHVERLLISERATAQRRSGVQTYW
jgi:hypothetical protein